MRVSITDEEALERGTKAAALLNNTEMMDFLEDERSLLLEALANTQPNETETRERLYSQHYAIGGFIAGLHQYVEKARIIVEAFEAPENYTEDTD